METKRIIVTIILTFLVLLSWSILTSKLYHVENKEVIRHETVIPEPSKPEPTPAPVEPEPLESSLYSFTKGQLEITFIESSAAIKEVKFPTYQNTKFVLKQGFLLTDKNYNFKRTSVTENSITFECNDTVKKIIKHFSFDKCNYCIELEIIFQNLSNSPLTFNMVVSYLDFNKDAYQGRYQDIALLMDDKILHNNARNSKTFDSVKFLAWRDRYFCGIVEPETGDFSTMVTKISSTESLLTINPKNLIISPGEQITEKFRIYLGPQDLSILEKISPTWSGVINYGTFDSISRFLLFVLNHIYNLVHNWGIAIILFSILIYFVLYPLSLKQMRSMKQMQVLQPQIEGLKEKYKDNPQKLNKAIMELYRENKVNPFSGCLPLILQIPIFFALYQALIRSISLKGANFLWIKDLSEPDRLFTLPTNLPIITNEINLLPILMAIVMAIQQRISSRSTGAMSSEQQKLMMIAFPVIFGFIFYRMPSGLVLYWFVNSLLMLIYQFKVNLAK